MSIRFKANQLPTGQKGMILIEVDGEDKAVLDYVTEWFREKKKKETEKGEALSLTVEIDLWQPLRTPNQWRLAMELLDRYCVHNRVNRENTWAGVKFETYPDVGEVGKKVKKSSADLTKQEMAHVIDHLVDKCLETRVPIRDIWTLWRKWRYAQDTDPLEGQEKAGDNLLCEACGKPLNAGTDARGNPQRGGQKAHVVSDGAGGPDEEWNLPDLCTECHMTVQHPQGWGELLKRHPDFQARYDYAQRKWRERGADQKELFTVPPDF